MMAANLAEGHGSATGRPVCSKTCKKNAVGTVTRRVPVHWFRLRVPASSAVFPRSSAEPAGLVPISPWAAPVPGPALLHASQGLVAMCNGQRRETRCFVCRRCFLQRQGPPDRTGRQSL